MGGGGGGGLGGGKEAGGGGGGGMERGGRWRGWWSVLQLGPSSPDLSSPGSKCGGKMN